MLQVVESLEDNTMERELCLYLRKYRRISTVEIKEKLHQFIDNGDDTFIKMFYEMTKAYIVQIEKDKMIAEGEEDVVMGRTHTLKEAKEILKKR
ncbi:MAG: hypothetical protein AAGF77_01330 [Bacteroidota bacterium]